MSRRLILVFLLAAALAVLWVPIVQALDEYPDPRPVAQEDVDPDGLEGIQASGTHPTESLLVSESSGTKALVRGFFFLARVIGL